METDIFEGCRTGYFMFEIPPQPSRLRQYSVIIVWHSPGELWEEGPYGALDQASADRTLPQWRCAFFAHHQMSTGDEDDVDLFVHAHLTGALLLQAPQLLLHGEVWKWNGPELRAHNCYFIHLCVEIMTKEAAHDSLMLVNTWEVLARRGGFAWLG